MNLKRKQKLTETSCNLLSQDNLIQKTISNGNPIEVEAHIEREELVNDTLRPYNTRTDCSKFFGKKNLGLSWEENLNNYIKTMPRFQKRFAVTELIFII